MLRRNVEAAGEHHLQRTAAGCAGSNVTHSRNANSDRQLAGDVLGPRQRLGQIDLQRVGAPIVGDQPGADVDRDEENEDALLIEEIAERLRASRPEHRRLLEVRRDDRSARRARRTATQAQQQQCRGTTRFGAIDMMPARAMTSQPVRAPRAARRIGDSPDRGWASINSQIARPTPNARVTARPRPSRTRLRASARWRGGAATCTCPCDASWKRTWRRRGRPARRRASRPRRWRGTRGRPRAARRRSVRSLP